MLGCRFATPEVMKTRIFGFCSHSLLRVLNGVTDLVKCDSLMPRFREAVTCGLSEPRHKDIFTIVNRKRCGKVESS